MVKGNVLRGSWIGLISNVSISSAERFREIFSGGVLHRILPMGPGHCAIAQATLTNYLWKTICLAVEWMTARARERPHSTAALKCMRWIRNWYHFGAHNFLMGCGDIYLYGGIIRDFGTLFGASFRWFVLIRAAHVRRRYGIVCMFSVLCIVSACFNRQRLS